MRTIDRSKGAVYDDPMNTYSDSTATHDFTEEPICFQGKHTAWATADGRKAQVRRGATVVATFSGETAWSDATRKAEDLNLAR